MPADSAPGRLAGRRLLVVIGGGIAAYKVLTLIRRLRGSGAAVRCVMTAAAAEFVTPLSVAALTEDKVYQDLFSLTDEAEMGHIRLTREADLVVVAPATAHLLARMAHGLADDLASTVLLATNKPVMIAPAMNVRMWDHPATQANLSLLEQRGALRVGPEPGDMACGEFGMGRMAEPERILEAILSWFDAQQRQDLPRLVAPQPDRIGAPPPQQLGHTIPLDDRRLAGRRALVTSGPTREPIDPVRFISNHSSGRQGHAIAAALARHGAEVTLVSGPVAEPDPAGVRLVRVETAEEMLAACRAALPVDVAVFAAAVADWRVRQPAGQKTKKGPDGPPVLELVENPDILATIARLPTGRPPLVIGFAAETEALVDHAAAKLDRKGCDWILANDVSPAAGTFGGLQNTIHLVRRGPDGGLLVEDWPRLDKTAVAERLALAIAATLAPGLAGRDG